MINLVKELKETLKEKNLSPEKASHYIGCGTKTVYRWLQNNNPPSLVYQRMIREGIEKIKIVFPVTIYETMLHAKALYRKIKRHVTDQEKIELFDINRTKGTKAYIEMLEKLVEKYSTADK